MKETFQILSVASRVKRGRATHNTHQRPFPSLGPRGRWLSCNRGGGHWGPLGPLCAYCLIPPRTCVQSGWRVTPTSGKLRKH